MTKYLRAFAWYGGKNSHLHWLLGLLPKSRIYVEPFAGSAAVLLNRSISPIECLNDLDGRITNFFRVLRDHGEELIRRLTLTPFSRREYGYCLPRSWPEFIEQDPIEAARCFLVIIKQSFLAKPKPTGTGDWGRTLTSVRRGMAQSVSGWLSIVENLPEVVMRLKSVTIEHKDALEVIKDFDTPDTFFYLDPPYVHESRATGSTSEYKFECKDDFHVRLCELLLTIKGKVALSGYDNSIYNEMLKGWYRYEAEPHTLGGDNRQVHNDGIRQEILWTNYDWQEVFAENQRPDGVADLTTFFNDSELPSEKTISENDE